MIDTSLAYRVATPVKLLFLCVNSNQRKKKNRYDGCQYLFLRPTFYIKVHYITYQKNCVRLCVGACIFEFVDNIQEKDNNHTKKGQNISKYMYATLQYRYVKGKLEHTCIQ